MSDNTKYDSTPVDLSSASLSTDMSLLDELFPSLGTGESSASHFTNQLAFLLNTLGSSDDEGSEGTNLLSPLQLSPPRLNEIHALATANLISQTQEAIMQEYNITDLDFEKPSEIVQNEALLSSGMAFPDDRPASNSEEIHVIGHNSLESCIPSTSVNQCRMADSRKLDSNMIPKCSEVDNQIIDSQKVVQHENLSDSNITLKETFVDNSFLTKVKIKTSLVNTSLCNLKEDASVPHPQNEECLGSHCNSENPSAAQLTVPRTLHTQCSIKSKEEFEFDNFTLHDSDLDNRTGNNISKNYSNIHRQTYVEKTQSHCPVKHTLQSSNVNPYNHLEYDTVDLEMKNNNDVLNYILPPKKRHIECNTVAVTSSDVKTQFEHEHRDAVSNILENETEHRFTGFISTAKGNKDKEKAQTTDKSIVYMCVICLKRLNNVEDLELHSANHQQYSCPFPGCVRTFTYRSHLSYHRKTHEGEKNYQCTDCGKVFTKAQHLDVHMLTHRQSKPFSCSVCSKTFTTAGNLKNHSRTHSGERPYACDASGCTKRFAELSSLKKHKNTHTGEKSYRCDICGKCFTQASSRSYHMKKHKEKL